MKGIRYTALIRTFNSERTLPATLGSLASQSHPPDAYVFVDSGSTDLTLALLPPGSAIRHYHAKPFNYSDALNEGIELINSEYTLIISSHTSLSNVNAIDYGIELLRSNDDIAAAYFLQAASDTFTFARINRDNFTGFNGAWNTCALYKTSFLKRRSFRPEVFSAEDQEWSKWLFCSEGKSIARISGAGMSYNNPSKDRVRKRLKEELAVAIYVKDEMLKLPYFARVTYRVIRPISSLNERAFNMVLLYNLLRYRIYGTL